MVCRVVWRAVCDWVVTRWRLARRSYSSCFRASMHPNHRQPSRTLTIRPAHAPPPNPPAPPQRIPSVGCVCLWVLLVLRFVDLLMIFSKPLCCWCLRVFCSPPSPPLMGSRFGSECVVATCLVVAGSSLLVCSFFRVYVRFLVRVRHCCADAPLTGEFPLLRRICLSVSCWY